MFLPDPETWIGWFVQGIHGLEKVEKHLTSQLTVLFSQG